MPEVVEDEVDFVGSLVSLADSAVLELGCGGGEFARRLAERTSVRSISALEVDRTQHALNREAPPHPKVTFGLGAAEDIPCADEAFDGVVMMKSLHHVPIERMDRAFAEIRRVLRPGGWVYVSEPVYAGTLNDIIRLFHDEGAVRAAAYEALQRACAARVLECVAERHFQMRARYASYEDFVRKHVNSTHSRIDYPDAVAAEVRRRLGAHMTPAGASLLRPVRVNLLRKAG